MYLPLCEVADTPFHIQGGYIMTVFDTEICPGLYKRIIEILAMWFVEMAISTNHTAKIWVSRFDNNRLHKWIDLLLTNLFF